MKKSNKTKLDYQKTHKPDFTAKDLWTNICMNQAGEFVYGFDDREEAKMYADAMKKRRRPVRHTSRTGTTTNATILRRECSPTMTTPSKNKHPKTRRNKNEEDSSRWRRPPQ